MGKKTVHDTVTELLPWFVNDSLGEKEQDLVQVHLADCGECRLERDRLQAISKLVEQDDTVLPDYRFSFKKVMARIATAERNRESASVGNIAAANTTRQWFPFAGIAAGVMATIMLVAGVQSFNKNVAKSSSVRDSEFRTLTSDGGFTGRAVQMALTFEQPIKAQTMRQALIETRSNIISGPDAEGTYIVEVEVPSHQTTQQYLDGIRRIEGVKLARYQAP